LGSARRAGRPRLPRRRLQPDNCRHGEVCGRARRYAGRSGGTAALPEFVAALKKPRKILILVKAGPPVDSVVEQLLGVGVETDDILVDCGNSLWTDTIRREKQHSDRCRFFGAGVSGGEMGRALRA